MRHRRYIAYILVTVLCLGVIAPGLLGVFPNVAKADSPTGYSIYWDDFAQRVWSLHTDVNQETSLTAFLSACGTIIENPDSFPTHNVVIFEDAEGNLLIHHFERNNGDSFYGKGWSSPEEYQWWNYSGTTNSYFKSYGYIRYNVITHTLSINSISQNYSYSARRAIIDLKNVTNPAIMFPMPFEFSAAGMKVYTARQIYSGNAGGFTMPVNINQGSAAPIVEEFNLVTFEMGSHLYLTIQDQIYLSRMDPETMGLYFDVGMSRLSGIEVDTLYFRFTYSDLMQIRYPGEIINDLVNVPTWGIYAIDIQGYIEDGYDEIFDAMLVDLDEDDIEYKYGQCINVPFNLPSAEHVEQENNQNIWNTFNEYKNTYNTTHVIPENLAQWLFNAEGSLMIPVSVNVPGNIWDDNHGSALVNPVWKWGGVAAEEKGFNYSLYDTIIVGTSIIDSFTTGYIGVRYFYDDTLDPMFQFVNLMHFDEILDSYDLIIIVPDDEGSLSENGTGAPVGYCGSYSGGVVYESNYTIGNTVQGFAIITEKAIQKQMLWNFNDGITKLYQLEVDYIKSEDKWKDSFLIWSSSVFYAIDSLGGKLDSLITKLGNIEEKLETLIQNTSEEESSYWFISLWNWVVQFNPSDNDFANSLQQYDNNWNNMPSLPPPSPFPMLPGGE